ncbi:MAG: RICIN domain-containing protein [Bdellovibrionota bacterium]
MKIILFFLLLLSFLIPLLLPPDAKAVTVGRSGRTMTLDGKPTFFLGMDSQQLVADPNVNYIAVLDKLAAMRMNKVRIWIDCYFGSGSYYHPWVLSNGKFNLDVWNQTYWNELKKMAAAANARGIIVELSIFDAYPGQAIWWARKGGHAWNKAFNVNGVFSTNSQGTFFPQFMDLNYTERSTSGKTLKDYQQALVDKVLTELGGFSNVYFEIMNEFPGVFNQTNCGGVPCINLAQVWQNYWINYINARSTRLISAHVHQDSGAHTIGLQYFWDNPNLDILNFHFYNSDPNKISALMNPAQRKGKILQQNESLHFWKPEAPNGVPAVIREIWSSFMMGGHYSVYLDEDGQMNLPGWSQVAQSTKMIRDFSDRFDLGKMSPVDANGIEYDSQIVKQGLLNSGWQVLANPSGLEYAVYFWNGTSGDIRMNLPSGSYNFTWYDARNGKILRTGSVAGGASVLVAGPGLNSFDPGIGAALMVKGSAGVDLIVTDVTYANGIFTARVKNIGAVSTRAGEIIGVIYYLNNEYKTYGYISTPLAAGASVNIYTQGGSFFIPAGVHSVTAFVDEKFVIAESNENNNKMTVSMAPNPTGIFITTLIAENSGKCVDVSGASLNDGAAIQQWACHGGKNENFIFTYKGGGYYQIKAEHSGRCLDVSGSGMSNGVPLIQYACSNTNNQLFKIEDFNGKKRIRSKLNNKCVDVAGAGTLSGAKIDLWDCYGGSNQNFSMNNVSFMTTLIAENSGKCVDVSGVSLNDGAAIQQWVCYGGKNENFVFIEKGGGYYEIRAEHSGKCLDVYGFNMSNGAALVQYACNNKDNQLFKVEDFNGKKRIRAKINNKCVDVAGASTLSGAKINLWDCYGGSNQNFSIK